MIDTPPVAEREGPRLSLKEILGYDFDRFIQDFVYKPIEEWAGQGKTDIITLRRLNKLLKKHGNNIFDVPAVQLPYATKHTVEGGELFRVKLPLTKDLVIDNFIKIFSSEEAYKKAVDAQEKVDNHFKDTELEKIIVPLAFKNDKKNMISYPMINASSFADVSSGMSDEQKQDALKKIIDTYQRFSLDLTKNKHIFKDYKGRSSLDDLMDIERAFDKFFFSRLDEHCSTKGYHMVIERPKRKKIRSDMDKILGQYFSELNTLNDDVIHKDLNPGNVLLSDDGVKIIDLEGLSKGFLEFDYAKLLTKTEASPELEEKIVRYAAENKAKLEGRNISEKEIQTSQRRYELNRISQELFTAARYLKRSQPIEHYMYDLKKLRKVPYRGQSFPMKHMADVSYTLAMRRIDNAIEKGLVPEEFKQKITDYMHTFREGLIDLGGRLEDYLSKYNPHAQGSQENIASVQTLDSIVETNGKEMDKELEKLKKNIAKGKNKKTWARRAAYAVMPLAIIAAVGLGNLYNKQSEQTVKHEISSNRSDKLYNWTDKLRVLNAIRENIPMNSTDVIAEKNLRFLYEKYDDKRTAELFFVDSKITMEAIWETKSEDYDVLEKYITDNYSDFRSLTLGRIGRGYVDNWVFAHKREYVEDWYNGEVDAAKKEYKAWVKAGRPPRSEKAVHKGMIFELNPKMQESRNESKK
ncbi:aminoglycoside phosphotransferase family protein [Candidatus Woesearchaeota archaeon]|nr:aminoglycoside phosphotransferase family protein [Candidatus Woesearchaeota archaeon]